MLYQVGGVGGTRDGDVMLWGPVPCRQKRGCWGGQWAEAGQAQEGVQGEWEGNRDQNWSPLHPELTQERAQILPHKGLEPGVVGFHQEAVQQAGDLQGMKKPVAPAGVASREPRGVRGW